MSNNYPEWNPHKESGYFTDFEEFILSDMTTKNEHILDDDDDDSDDINLERTLHDVDLAQEANDFINQPTSSNIFYPIPDNFEKQFFKGDSFKIHLRNSLECQMDQENRMEIFDTLPTELSASTSRVPSPDLFGSSSGDERVSPDIFSTDSNEDGKIYYNQNVLEPIVTVIENHTTQQALIAGVEKCVVKLLQDIVSKGNASLLMANCAKWKNCEMFNGILALKEPSALINRSVTMKHLNCRYHFAMIMYVLSAVYHLLITNTTCTERELYYDDPELAENQLNVKSAVRDVSNLLNASPWELGIRSSSKGLIAGAIRIHMSNSLIIDCYMYDGATLIPADVQGIAYLETTAKYVLIIEKDTIFEKLLKQNILLNLNSDVILITGKGFPDLSTRLMVKRLWNDFRLPTYVLVDADPYGIEIMFVYRFGSRAMVLNSDQLACPQIRWIGIQPSEIDILAIPSVAQTKEDNKKVIELLQRSYISAEIRIELEILQRLNRKAEIEGVASFSANFLVSDYIPNKIKRHLFI